MPESRLPSVAPPGPHAAAAKSAPVVGTVRCCDAMAGPWSAPIFAVLDRVAGTDSPPSRARASFDNSRTCSGASAPRNGLAGAVAVPFVGFDIGFIATFSGFRHSRYAIPLPAE